MSNTHCSPHYFLSETVLMRDPFWNYCTVSLCCVSLWSPWQFGSFWRVYGTLTAVLWSWQPWIVSVWLTGALGVVLSLISCLSVSLQGSFVACMTATLRQMDDYHYTHLISTFGKMRTDVVVSSVPTKTSRNSLQPHRDISQTDIRVPLIHGTTIKIVIINVWYLIICIIFMCLFIYINNTHTHIII